MTQIQCNKITKRYNQELLFRDFSYSFESPNSYAILGHNSIGKSTLLKIIGGVMDGTSGIVEYHPMIRPENAISYTSPALDLLSDFTVQELFDFHYQFKKPKIDIVDQLTFASFQKHLDKTFQNLSSGLINKVKLTLALFSDTPFLLLDEPCSNFDEENCQWYLNMIDRFCKNQLIIVASNSPIEYSFCSNHINLQNFK